jgi:hypothetical protein
MISPKVNLMTEARSSSPLIRTWRGFDPALPGTAQRLGTAPNEVVALAIASNGELVVGSNSTEC